MPYDSSPHGYLARAKQRLCERTHEALFYAAFELRCCVESRQDWYADAIEHLRVKITPWKIGQTAKRLENVFDSQKISHLTFGLKGNDKFEFYYTPVTKKLYKNAEKLGEFLHCMRTHKIDDDDAFWPTTRIFIEGVYRDAWIACHGTLLVPPLFQGKTRALHPIKIERYTEELIAWMDRAHQEGTQIVLKVKYLDKAPTEWVCDL
jgi:hypothetical protein